MMILELRDLYYQKYDAFVKCRASCQQVCDVAHQLYAELDPAVKSIYQSTRCLRSVPGEESLAHISDFGDQMELQASYVADDLAGIHDIMFPVFCRVGPAISLTKFKDGPTIYQELYMSLRLQARYAKAIHNGFGKQLKQTSSGPGMHVRGFCLLPDTFDGGSSGNLCCWTCSLRWSCAHVALPVS